MNNLDQKLQELALEKKSIKRGLDHWIQEAICIMLGVLTIMGMR